MPAHGHDAARPGADPAQVYKDPRPKEYFDRFHARARTREPDWVYDVMRIAHVALRVDVLPRRSLGAEKVPATGPVILAPNHFSFMDHFFAGAFIRRRVRFMAKSQLFVPPMQLIYSHGGVFPVRRGYQDEDAFVTANGILQRGGAIVMYCEGGRSRTGSCPSSPSAASAGWRWSRARRSCRWRSTGRRTSATGSARSSRRCASATATSIRWPRLEDATRDQQQAVANEIFGRIKTLYATLDG